MRTIKYMFRAYGLKPMEGRPRGTLTVCFDDDRWFIFFDHSIDGKPERTTGEYINMYFTGERARPCGLPEPERDLGDVKFVVFADALVSGSVPSFEVYSRLPVPPPDTTVTTKVVAAHVVPQVRAAK